MSELADLELRVARIERELEVAPFVTVPAIASVRKICEDAARITGLKYAEIIGQGRARELSYARFAVIYAARLAYGYSLPRIGRALGNRDHTTILSGEKRARELREQDLEFLELSERLYRLASERARQFLDLLTHEGDRN